MSDSLISVLHHRLAVKMTFSAADLEDINELMSQLTTKCSGLSLDDLEQIVGQGRYLYAKRQDTIIGVATLFLLSKATGRFAEVHDVVVNNKFRGHGIGSTLMKQAIDLAKRAGAKYIELTSNPGRKAANKLYRSLGFVCIARANSGGGQGTNLYHLEL